MDILQLVYLTRISEERDKHVWEDRDSSSWDEFIGRLHLLKANECVDDEHYQDAVAYFEQAILLLAKDDVDKSYYARALADKALVQCFLGQYDAALATIDQALAVSHRSDEFYRDDMLNNRCAILVLKGAYSEALNALHEQLEHHPQNSDLQFTLATCLLHVNRYSESIAAYE